MPDAAPPGMRAAWYRRQGPARRVLEVGRLPTPSPRAGEVRVRVHASGVNPTDTYARSGRRGPPSSDPLVVPHQDGAGIVDAVGPGVPATRLGERAWVHFARQGGPFGTAAEYVVVPAHRAVALPSHLSFEIGACLGVPWLTAHRAVSLDGPLRGSVLVMGGAGAVASYAVQLAARQGADVIATARAGADVDGILAAGARAVVDHRSEDFTSLIRAATGGRPVDRVIEVDLAANARRLAGVLADEGTVVVYGTSRPEAVLPASAALRGRWTVRFVYAYAMTDEQIRAALDDLTRLEGEHPLRHLPVTTYPLERIAQAHEAVERGNRGRRAVVIP